MPTGTQFPQLAEDILFAEMRDKLPIPKLHAKGNLAAMLMRQGVLAVVDTGLKKIFGNGGRRAFLVSGDLLD